MEFGIINAAGAGIMALRRWLLVIVAVVFWIGHVYVTRKNEI